MRGQVWERQEQSESAIEDFNMCLMLDASHVNAAYSKAAAKNRSGNFLEAIMDYRAALALDSKNYASP